MIFLVVDVKMIIFSQKALFLALLFFAAQMTNRFSMEIFCTHVACGDVHVNFLFEIYDISSFQKREHMYLRAKTSLSPKLICQYRLRVVETLAIRSATPEHNTTKVFKYDFTFQVLVENVS
jgi:hypothetical protein